MRSKLKWKFRLDMALNTPVHRTSEPAAIRTECLVCTLSIDDNCFEYT